MLLPPLRRGHPFVVENQGSWVSRSEFTVGSLVKMNPPKAPQSSILTDANTDPPVSRPENPSFQHLRDFHELFGI